VQPVKTIGSRREAETRKDSRTIMSIPSPSPR